MGGCSWNQLTTACESREALSERAETHKPTTQPTVDAQRWRRRFDATRTRASTRWRASRWRARRRARRWRATSARPTASGDCGACASWASAAVHSHLLYFVIFYVFLTCTCLAVPCLVSVCDHLRCLLLCAANGGSFALIIATKLFSLHGVRDESLEMEHNGTAIHYSVHRRSAHSAGAVLDPKQPDAMPSALALSFIAYNLTMVLHAHRQHLHAYGELRYGVLQSWTTNGSLRMFKWFPIHTCPRLWTFRI